MANGPQEKGDDRAPRIKNFSWPSRITIGVTIVLVGTQDEG